MLFYSQLKTSITLVDVLKIFLFKRLYTFNFKSSMYIYVETSL